MLHFAERGFKCVRLGSVTKEPLTVEHPNIIDYSRSVLQSDFMDIFLIHRAKFIVCSATGIGDGALRKSIVYVNFVPMLRHLPQILSRRSIFLPKYVYSEERGRNLTLREIQEGGSFLKSEKYSDEGLKCVENSSEEILSACIQMNDPLDSKYQPDDAESELQKRFWRIFDTDWEEGEDYIRVSADFLAANRGQLQ
jgi:putative glycosyltransferase (TIGR04372 family)